MAGPRRSGLRRHADNLRLTLYSCFLAAGAVPQLSNPPSTGTDRISGVTLYTEGLERPPRAAERADSDAERSADGQPVVPDGHGGGRMPRSLARRCSCRCRCLEFVVAIPERRPWRRRSRGGCSFGWDAVQTLSPPLGRVPVGTLGVQLAHRISFQVDPVGAVHDAVADRADDGGLADYLMPRRRRQQRANLQGSPAMPAAPGLQQLPGKVVDDQQCLHADLLQFSQALMQLLQAGRGHGRNGYPVRPDVELADRRLRVPASPHRRLAARVAAQRAVARPVRGRPVRRRTGGAQRIRLYPVQRWLRRYQPQMEGLQAVAQLV